MATLINLNDTTPVAVAGGQNVKWQSDASSPTNVSAYIDFSNVLVPINISSGNGLTFGGTTSSKVGLFGSGTTLAVRLGDNSADAPLTSSYLAISGVNLSSKVPLTVTQLGTGPTNVGGAALFITDGVTPGVGTYFETSGHTFRIRNDNLLVNSNGNLAWGSTGMVADGGGGSPTLALYTNAPAGGYTGITNGSAQIDFNGTGLLALTANPGGGNKGEILLSPVSDTITFYGNTSGNAAIGTNVIAGTPNQINLPTTTGSANGLLTTDGANPQQTSWTLTPTLTTITVTGATPTGSGSNLGLGNTVGFGAGTAGTAVTTTTKGAGTGPTTPQTVVNYLEIDLGGTKYWIPLVH